MISSQERYTEILCKRISCIVAQTIARQLDTAREHVDLIGPLSYIAKETFNDIGCLNMPMHALRELVKRQEMLFVLSQASYRFWIALAILGFESCKL